MKLLLVVILVPLAIAFALGLAWRELAELGMRRVTGTQSLETLVTILGAGVRQLNNDLRIALLSALWDAEVLPSLVADQVAARRRKYEALHVPFPATTPEISVPHREEPAKPRVQAPSGQYIQFDDRSAKEH